MNHCPQDTDKPPRQAKKSFADYEQENEEFAYFWSLYPRHVGKAAALKAWKRAAISERIKDEIMAALKCQLPGMLKQGKSFIPHASTWLNQRRWEDEDVLIASTLTKRVIACENCGDAGLVSVPERIVQGLRQDAHWERCSCSIGQLPGITLPTSAAPF